MNDFRHDIFTVDTFSITIKLRVWGRGHFTTKSTCKGICVLLDQISIERFVKIKTLPSLKNVSKNCDNLKYIILKYQFTLTQLRSFNWIGISYDTCISCFVDNRRFFKICVLYLFGLEESWWSKFSNFWIVFLIIKFTYMIDFF